MEMLELPQQSIEEGVWEIKEVEMLEWTYQATLQNPHRHYLSLGGQENTPCTKAVRKAQGRRSPASLRSSVVSVLCRLGGQACHL